MKVHELKLWCEFYEDVRSGDKSFEIRKNDRDYQTGDTLILNEFDYDSDDYTGRWMQATVKYVLLGGSFGLHEDYVVMAISIDEVDF
jgi:ASC-1-like (ASCH) protein